MSRNLIVVPITTGYLEEGEALLRSLMVHNPEIPVHVISRNGEVDFLKDKYENVKLVLNEPVCDSEFRQIRTSRFRHAADMKDQFDVVCLLDADMVSIRPMGNIFKMAMGGTVLACSNNTLFRYLQKDFKAMAVEAPKDISVVHGSFSTVPMFINPTIHEKFLRAIFDNATGNDLDVPNLLTHVVDNIYKESLYLLDSFSFTNIHHSMEKPETFIRDCEDGGYYSQQGQPVYMMHGHLWDPKYWEQLIEPMEKNYGYYPKYIECAKQCILTMVKEYMKYYVPSNEKKG